ncbi:MAG: ankyrin repeat domain-containing protein, partial [Rickettsia endosymbiont of Ixodes persulcatus]|nr:ankyrin repeat domain-containing protein [Rickettsia endosymbiont of Ixodes persulcatus]
MLDTENHNEYAGLLEAAEAGDLSQLKYILKASLEAKDSKWGWTALHYAAWKGHLEIIKFLARQGANLNAKDYEDKTALIVAINYKQKEVKAYLEEASHKLNTLNTDLLEAAQEGDLRKVEHLITEGAQVNTKDSKWSWTALHYAAWKGHLEIIKFLARQGANLNAKDYE